MLAVGDDDQVEERVERVLEQTPLPQHVLEELDVLDARGELPAEIPGKIEPLPVAQLVRDGAFDDERAQGAAPSTQGRDEHRLQMLVKDLGLLEPQTAGRLRVGVVDRYPVSGGPVGRIGRGDEPERARPPVVQPDRGAPGADVGVELPQHPLDGGAQAVPRRHAPPERPGELPEGGRRGLAGSRWRGRRRCHAGALGRRVPVLGRVAEAF